jgi:hypothetical protein
VKGSMMLITSFTFTISIESIWSSIHICKMYLVSDIDPVNYDNNNLKSSAVHTTLLRGRVRVV